MKKLFLAAALIAAPFAARADTGLRIGLGIGWMALVAGELVAAPSGLGYLINNARTIFRSDYILLGMVLIGVLGLILDYVMRQLMRTSMPWHRAV